VQIQDLIGALCDSEQTPSGVADILIIIGAATGDSKSESVFFRNCP
jgi:hypothetical protein